MSDLIGAKTPRKPTDSKDSLESTQVTDQDRASLCAALPHANPRVLGTVLGHMTGDMKWLTEPYQRALHGAATTAAGDGLECQRREMLDALLP